MLNLLRARGTDSGRSWFVRLGARIGRPAVLLPAILVPARSAPLSGVCRAVSKNDSRFEKDASGPDELLTSTRRVRWRSSGGFWSLRNGLSVKMRLRKRGIVLVELQSTHSDVKPMWTYSATQRALQAYQVHINVLVAMHGRAVAAGLDLRFVRIGTRLADAVGTRYVDLDCLEPSTSPYASMMLRAAV